VAKPGFKDSFAGEKILFHNKNIIVKKGPVTKIENIKTDSTKILRPTHFSGPKDIKTNLTD
jgi:hypothetical protein